MNNLLAKEIILNKSFLEGFGPLGLEGANKASAPIVFNKFLSGIIGIITIVGAIWFIILLFSGAVGIMTAGSDKAAVESAKKKITNGLIGLGVLVAGIFILDLIGQILGLKFLLDPGSFISTFKLK